MSCDMSKFEKAIKKLLNPRAILTYKELEYILGKLGYYDLSKGKTSGSRKAYIHHTTNHIIRIHKHILVMN